MAQFEKGKSGNKNGRPRGSSNRSLSNAAYADRLGKGTPAALQAVMDVIQSDNNSEKLRAALGWLKADKDMRDFVYKMRMDAKGKQEAPPEEVESTPVISLRAVEK